MRKFIVERVYDIDDEYFMGDVKEIRLKEDDVEVIAGNSEGIYDQMKGFFKALNYLGTQYEYVYTGVKEAFR